jgi:hypothetical protein
MGLARGKTKKILSLPSNTILGFGFSIGQHLTGQGVPKIEIVQAQTKMV